MPAATAAAEPPLEPPGTRSRACGIVDRPIRRVLVRGSHCKLVAVELAQENRPRIRQLAHRRCRVGRPIAFQNLRPRRGRESLQRQHVLNPERNSRQLRQRFAFRSHAIDARRLRQRVLVIDAQKRVNLRILAGNARLINLRHRSRRRLAASRWPRRMPSIVAAGAVAVLIARSPSAP